MTARGLVRTMLLFFAIAPALAMAQSVRPGIPASSAPRLIVFVTVDAMRADYLPRFDKQLTGGLAMLYHQGAVFTNGHQDHAITETAPGHASTMSGRFPVHTGISMNTAGVSDTTVFLIESGDTAASPFRFKGTTLTDWLAAKDPRTKVLSVSRKDRGAILPIGASKREIYWFALNGLFTTSTYYADTLPTWVQKFNARRAPLSYAGRTWSTLLSPSEYPEPDSVLAENGGENVTFPHVLATDTLTVPQLLPGFPWMDDLTLDLALSGVSALKLGVGPETDLLAISLSTTDAVGHKYGPDSRELHDQVLRLDRTLGKFFDSLFRIVRKRDVVIALTADHGLTPYPEVHAHDFHPGARRVNWNPVVAAFRSKLQAKGVGGRALSLDDGVLTLDRPQLKNAGIDADSLVSEFREAMLQVPGVIRADKITELQKQDTTRDAVARRWLHMFDEKSPVELVISAEPFDYVRNNTQAQHGTPYDPDTHVPIIFFGAQFRRGMYDGFARVVDMGPTLAEVANAKPLEKLDGKPLTMAILGNGQKR